MHILAIRPRKIPAKSNFFQKFVHESISKRKSMHKIQFLVPFITLVKGLMLPIRGGGLWYVDNTFVFVGISEARPDYQ